jgi:L-seryl-tRNA(Ser) seleniumtransferase
MSLDTGEREARGGYVRELLRSLTGAEDALVVNNNAAAVLLALAATSAGLSVPVARGELIEIGGAYRLPEVMSASGAHLVEVGTTNRTRLADYRVALQLHRCGAILKVHTSNYRMVGFTEEADLRGLAGVAGDAGIPLILDAGSGLLDTTTPWLPGETPTWLAGEPGVRQALGDGADLVTFSGDKLLGGPQSGIIAGEAGWVSRLRAHPLARALRVDAVTYAALAATLSAYAEGDASSIPFWAMATAPPADIEARAGALAEGVGGRVERGLTAVGAGSAPDSGIETTLVVVEGAGEIFDRLLDARPPVLARRVEGALVLDLRTCMPEDDRHVEAVVSRCLS